MYRDLNVSPLGDDSKLMKNFENLFVVSTVGQIRNVGLLCSLHDIGSVFVLIVYSRRNMNVLQRIEDVCLQLGFKFEAIEIPIRFQSYPSPRKFLSVSKKYKKFLESFEFDRLWLSNINSYYYYFAQEFSKQGKSICYFEEGLGTYKAVNHQSYAVPDFWHEFSLLPDRVHNLIKALAVEVGQFYIKPVFKLFSHIVRPIGNFFRRFYQIAMVLIFSSQAGRRFAKFVFGDVIYGNHSVWKNFDLAVVANPDGLDPSVFGTATCSQLDMSSMFEVKCEELSNLHHLQVDRCDLMLVTQSHGFSHDVWARVVAKEIARKGIKKLFLKLHPKETPSALDAYKLAFAQIGVEVLNSEAFSMYPAEKLIKPLRIKRVIGISSSTLFYGRLFLKDVLFESIGVEITDELRSMDQDKIKISKLQGDVALLKLSMDVTSVD